MTKSTLYLVDLAGSERVSKSKASGSRLDEAKNINLALLALGNCIQALADKNAKYVPFRDSKLTRLLEDSLGGNSKTSLVITIGPSLAHFQESASSLLFGSRAMKVENRPELNIKIDYKALCAQLQTELDKINDNNNMSSIEKEQLNEKIAKLSAELENCNNDKTEMQILIDELQRNNKDIDLTAYEESKQIELSKLKSYYEEKMKKKESKFKKSIEEYDKTNAVQEQSIAHYKVLILDLENKVTSLKHELKMTKEELEHEKNDRQFRISQMTTEIEDYQRALALEKAKNEKEALFSILENRPEGQKLEGIAKFEEILTNNEENFRRTIEEYEQDINILRGNLTKLSAERDELAAEKTKLLGKLGSITKKAAHIAKESVKIRSKNENETQEVKILKDHNHSLQQKYNESLSKLEEAVEEKDALLNNVKILSKMHQEFINNDKTKAVQLKFITEEVYMTMKNMERNSIRFQEKLLYFITQKAQFLSELKKNVLKSANFFKNSKKNWNELLVTEKDNGEFWKSNSQRLTSELKALNEKLIQHGHIKLKI